jgi:AcrR family transcriptional regulator
MIGAFSLRTRLGSGIYQTGRERVTQILEAALDIFTEQGYAALTLREVARRCNVRVGAVSYYYKSPNDLLLDMINMVLLPYADNFKAIRAEPGLTAEQRLERVIRLLLEDIQTKQTTRLFPHLWMLANYDPAIAKAVDSIYILERLTLTSLIEEINPHLSAEERETLAVYIGASVAGSTIFVGFEKAWSNELPLYSAIACRALVELVRTIRPEELNSYGWFRDERSAGWKAPTLLNHDEFRSLMEEAAAGELPGAAEYSHAVATGCSQ